MQKLKVGTGKIKITLPEEILPFPCWKEEIQYEAVISDLYVRALLLDNGKKKFLFLGCDCGPTLDREQKRYFAEKYGLDLSCILACNTHNHSTPKWGGPKQGPFMPSQHLLEKMQKYTEFALNAYEKAVQCAHENMQEAMYGYGEGKSYINVNTDRQFEDGYWMQAPNPEGFSDKTLAVLKFVDNENKLIGAVVDYACYATCAFCAADVDGKVKITQGFPGIASSYIEDREKDAVILWMCGAAGDQGPLLGSGFPMKYEKDGYAEVMELPPGARYQIQEYVGLEHAQDIIKTLSKIECKHDKMEIRTSVNTIMLTGQRPPANADMMLNRLFCDNMVRKERPELCVNGRPPEKKLVEMIPEGTVALQMQLAVLGDTAWVGIAGELYNRLGWMIKEASPFKKTVVINCTDGDSAHFIMDDDSIEHNTFRRFSRVYPEKNNRKIMNGVNEMFYAALNI